MKMIMIIDVVFKNNYYCECKITGHGCVVNSINAIRNLLNY